MDDIKTQFANGLTLFGNSLEYAFLSGRFAYMQGVAEQSDIDIIVVLKPGLPVGGSTIKGMIGDFVDFYMDMHLSHGYKPDMLFPGEYITSGQVSDGIEGRGYDVDGASLSLPHVNTDDYWMTPKHEYRAWRNMSAFNNRQFLAGDIARFECNRRRAWEAILKFVAVGMRRLTPETAMDHIIEGGDGYLGISRLYEPMFSSSEMQTIEITMELLAERGFLDKSNGTYTANGDLELWEKYTAERVARDEWESCHIVDWEDTRKRAEDAYRRRSGNKIKQLREHS